MLEGHYKTSRNKYEREREREKERERERGREREIGLVCFRQVKTNDKKRTT